jgi:hypothetical protein
MHLRGCKRENWISVYVAKNSGCKDLGIEKRFSNKASGQMVLKKKYLCKTVFYLTIAVVHSFEQTFTQLLS